MGEIDHYPNSIAWLMDCIDTGIKQLKIDLPDYNIIFRIEPNPPTKATNERKDLV